jgi:hypothetical protein
VSAELVTPTDELTGLPLPIVPIENPVRPDWHHHFHPRLSPRLVNKEGGSALRAVRLQRVDYDAHHRGYHRYFDGPKLPKKMNDRFGLIIMSAAGYIPEQGLDFTDGEPAIVDLTEEQAAELRKQIKVGSPTSIRYFIQDYVISQKLEDVNVNETTIEEFISTKNEERRRVLGHTLLGLVTKKATEPLDENYHRIRQQQQIAPNTPNSVMKFTKALLGPVRSRDRLVNRLHDRVAASYS